MKRNQYPRAYQAAFGAQMLQTFKDQYADIVAQKGNAGLLFWLGVVGDAVTSILGEHLAQLKGEYQVRRFVILGLVLGAGFGIWDLIATQLNPLSEDDPGALLLFYGPMFAIWGLTGFVGARRTGRLLDGVKVAAIVAFVTFVVFDVAAIIRVNVFLDVLTHRSDWQNLLVRFQASGFTSLRAYANYEYITGSPLKILVATVIGSVTGLIGGLFGWLGRRSMGQVL